VGVVTGVNQEILAVQLAAGYVPVVAPIGLNTGPRPEGAPATLNFNADVVAGEIAAAVAADRLIFLTDVPGILDRAQQLIPELSVAEARALLDSGVALGGMIPKVQSCLRALSATTAAGVACIVDGREPHALMQTLGQGYPGTNIRR
jgi:acetylglutamate kinase